MASSRPLKDHRLDRLAAHYSVAQFVSFTPDQVELRHSQLRHARPSATDSLEDVLAMLLQKSCSNSVNVRSFLPQRDKGCPFIYGLRDVAEASAAVRGLAQNGYYTIVNETIDVDDGGVSGVLMGGIVEFTPGDTPRGVEKDGVVSLEYDVAMQLLTTIYGFAPDLKQREDERLEWSIHPGRAGTRHTHTVVWESEAIEPVDLAARHNWPNRFSEHIGDKAYGLLIAHILGARVPRTTVVGRNVAPFSFGTSSGTGDRWLRTCPRVQAPGKFSTTSGWVDPFTLLAHEDPSGSEVVSVLSQEAVDSRWSGATLPDKAAQKSIIEGASGTGQAFMLGERSPDRLPAPVIGDVLSVVNYLNQRLQVSTRIEWAHDGNSAWVLQLHLSPEIGLQGGVISPGDASEWLKFHVADGLDALRELLPKAQDLRAGVLVIGQVGLTSHVGDLLRKAGIPARFGPSGTGTRAAVGV